MNRTPDALAAATRRRPCSPPAPTGVRARRAATAAIVMLAAATGCDGPQNPSGTQPAQNRTAVASQGAVEAVFRAVHEAREAGDPARAEMILAAAIDTYPQDVDLRLAMHAVLIEQGEARRAEAYQHLASAIELGAAGPGELLLAGRLAWELGELERAGQHLRAAAAAAPDAAEAALWLASLDLELGRLDTARAGFARVVALDPGAARAWAMLAEIALRDGAAEVALQHAARARELEPASVTWLLIQARAMRRTGDAEGALLVLNSVGPAAAATPAWAELVRLRAELSGALARPADAAEAYRLGFALSPALAEDPQALFEAAVWADRAGDRGLALRWATEASDRGHPTAGALATRLGSGV